EKLHSPNTTAAEKKEVQSGIKDKSATFKTPIDPAAWHKARVEIVADEMLVSIDGKVVGYLKSEGIAHPTKNLLGFTILGKSALIDNIRVWDATVSADWPGRKAEVLAGIGK